MNSRKFNLRVIIYSLMSGITASTFFVVVQKENMLVTSISLALLWFVWIYLLIRYVNKINRDLLVFLQSFKYDDTSLVFSKNKKQPFQELYLEFNRIIDEFGRIKEEKEIEHQYFESSIMHVNTGLIAWDKDGKIELFNKAAQHLLRVPYVAQLEGFKRVNEDLPEILDNILSNEKKIVKIPFEDEILSLYIRASEFKFGDKPIKLVSLQNIRPELEETEMETWQRLVRILTHEIVNSISPISIASSSLIKMFEDDEKAKKPERISEKELQDALEGLKAIHRRSLGLKQFVEDYKKITELQSPSLKEVDIGSMLDNLYALLKGDLIRENIDVTIDILPKDLTLICDQKMVEQVLINLIKNAVQSLDSRPTPAIHIKVWKEKSITIIKIIDNGIGIPYNLLDFIFMPFFTTKNSGSGIGLSLARQIMRLHKGNISLSSVEDQGTTVRLLF
ncbi:PAS domain-containing sensor histidine kinase [Bacteroidota bacterium]